jgi:hypothetical protein
MQLKIDLLVIVDDRYDNRQLLITAFPPQDYLSLLSLECPGVPWSALEWFVKKWVFFERERSKLLNPLGFELREASNGQEAIAVWETFEPHLI